MKIKKFLAGLLFALMLMPQAAYSARTVEYAEDLTLSTAALTSYQDKVTKTFTPDANAVYYWLWTAKNGMNNISNDFSTRLYNETDAVTMTEYNIEAHDNSDIYSGFGLAKYTAPGSPGSMTFKVQYKSESTGATASIEDATLVAIKGDAGDVWANSDGSSTYNTDTTLQTKTTLGALNNGSQYLLIAYAEVGASNTTYGTTVELDISGTTYGAGDRYVSDATTIAPWGTIVRYTATGSETITIKYGTTNTLSTASIRNARILALKLSGTVDNNYYSEARSRTTTTSTTPQDKATLTTTPLNLSHLVIGCQLIDENGITQSGEFQFTEDGTASFEGSIEPQSASSRYATMIMYRKTFTNASHTWKNQYNTETSLATGSSEAAISVLQLEATPAGGAETHYMRGLLGVGN
jgi:hypothetical protein